MKIWVLILIIAVLTFLIGILIITRFQLQTEESVFSSFIKPFIREQIIQPSSNYNIEGDSVYIDDENVLINVTPHTSNSPIINFSTKSYSGEIDIVFGFDTTEITPRAAKYNPRIENVTKSYICKYEFNYTTNPNYFWCYQDLTRIVNNETNESEEYSHIIFEHSYDSRNVPTKTAYWDVEELVWTDVSGAFNSINYDFEGFDKWYYKKGFNVEPNKSYVLNLVLQPKAISTPSYKYFFGVKPSSESLSQAISNGHFYYIDPWTEGLNNSLVAYWKLNDTTTGGGALVKEELFLYNGSNYGADTSAVGIINGSFDFEKSDRNASDYDRVQINGIPNWGSAVTISMWINQESDSTGFSGNDVIQTIFQQEAIGGALGGIMVVDDLRLSPPHRVYSFHSGGTNTIELNDNILSEWEHIVATYNGSMLIVYQNGTQVGNTSTYGGNLLPSNGSTFLAFGNHASNYNREYDGKIDEVSMWSRVLNESEITSLYNNHEGITYDPTLGQEEDTQAPNWTLNQTNATIAGESILHSVYWEDDNGLSSYIFQFCNGTYNETSGACGTTYEYHEGSTQLINGTNSSATSNLDSNDDVYYNVSADVSGGGAGGSGSDTVYPIYHTNTKLNAAQLTEAQVADLADEDGSGTAITKNAALYLEMDDNSSEIDTLTSVNCSINIDSVAAVNGGQYWEVLDANGGNQLDQQAINDGAESDATYTITNLQSSGLDPAEVPTMQVVVHGETSGGPGSITVDWARCDMVYTTPGESVTAILNITHNSSAISQKNIEEINISLNLKSNVSETYYFDVYNWTDSLWHEMKTGSVSTSEVTWSWVNNTPASNFIHENADIIKVRLRATGSESFKLQEDYLSFNVTTPYSWVNDSAVSFTGTGNWSNITKTVNSTEGATIAWKVYANDTSDNWNSTDVFTYNTTGGAAPQASISIQRIYPNLTDNNYNATQNEFFNVTLNVTCLSGTCGTINVSLDPWLYDQLKRPLFKSVSANPDTTISTCQELNSVGETYILDADVNSNKTCFNITASDITLDCGGHYINYSRNGTLGYGIYSNQNYTIVKNCYIYEGNSTTSSKYGVYYQDNNYNEVKNNTIIMLGEYGNGVRLRNADHNNVTGNTITTYGDYGNGVRLWTALNNRVTGNTINTYGIDFGHTIQIYSSSQNNIIADNTLMATNFYGIYFYIGDNDNNTFYENTITANGNYGTCMDINSGTSGNIFYNNLFNCSTLVDISYDSDANSYNTTKQLGTRHFSNGNYIGGNYWTNSSSTGYSDTCSDANGTGFCDSSYDLTNNTIGCDSNNCDYYPYSSNYTESPSKSGLIPIVSDYNESIHAFYTNASSNPLTTSSLNSGQSELVTFYVNATGDVDDVFEFYAYANLTSDLNISNQTVHWNITIISEEVADDTTFSVSLPTGTTIGVFQPSNSTHQQVTPTNQSATVPFLNITNQGNVNLDIYFNLNTSGIANIVLKADTDNDYSGASIINQTIQKLISALGQGNSQSVWLWSDFNHTTPQTSERLLNVSVAKS